MVKKKIVNVPGVPVQTLQAFREVAREKDVSMARMIRGFMRDTVAKAEAEAIRERHPNARLIAAAPDLLEACKKAKQFIVNGVELGYIRLFDKPDPALDTLPAICAAIAKAEVQG